jgi:peptide/nickel transport system substrate-binding protein
MIRAILLALLLVVANGQVAAGQPAPAKSATIAVAQEPEGFFNPSSVAGRLAASLVFDPLVGLDDHMRPYPVLAAELPTPEFTGSGADRRLVVTMPLRDGVTWSDGVPFTADDVVFTWQLMANQQSGFETTVEDKIKSVDKVDDLTVRFTYLSANEARALDPLRYRDQGEQPLVDPLYFFGLYDAPAIYPKHILRLLVGDDPRHNPDVSGLAGQNSSFARNPVGTGPYTLASWDPGSALVFTSRGVQLPQRLARPAIDSLTLRVIPDKNDSLTALQAGDVQVVTQDGLDVSDAPVLDALPGVQAAYTPGAALEQITFNLNNPALGDVNVRHAIAYAIDRQALNQAALFGKAQVPASVVPDWSWAANPDVPAYPSDVERAAQILDRAGWTGDGVRQKNGQRLSFSLSTTFAPFRPALTEALRDQLAQVGIELRLDFQPASVLFDRSASGPLVARKFDLAELAWIGGYDPGADQVYTLHSASVPTRGNFFVGGNYGNYHSPRGDELLDQVQRSLDPGFRKGALAEAQSIWQTDLPALPLVVRPVVTAVRQNLSNFRPTPTPATETWNVEQWDFASAASEHAALLRH